MTIPTMADLYDTVKSDITLGHSLPSDFDSYDLNNLKYISDYYNALLFSGSYGEIFSALILRQVESKMKQATLHGNEKKWSSYFIKEQNMIPLINQLNLTSPSCLTQKYKNQTMTENNCVDPPSFSANLLMELHEDDSFNHFIKIKYNGFYVNLCGIKNTMCEFGEFWRKASALNIDYQTACYPK